MAVQISGNDITVPRDGSFTRNVTIGGTLTYEDVTNIDSVGLVTARNGIEIGARPGVAASISVDGNMIVSGISTFGGNIAGQTASFAQNLAIRLSSATNNLHVHQDDSDKSIAQFTNNTTGSASGDGFQIGLSSSEEALLNMKESSNMVFKTADTERLRIDSSGRLLLGLASDSRTTSMIISGNTSGATSFGVLNIDIGTTSVSADTNLGIIRFGATGDRRGADIRGMGDGTWNAGSSHPTRLSFYTCASSATSPTESLRIDSSGRLLLGTTTEGHGDADEFTIANTGGANMGMTIRSGTGALGNIFFSDGTSGDSEYRGMIQYGHNNDSMRFSTSGSERARIDSSGNIHFGSDTLNGANTVSVVPSEGRISFGMDGRNSLVTSENGCYIFSGDGASGDILAGELVIQTRSNQNRDLHFATGATPLMRGRFRGADGDFFLGNDLGAITNVGTAIRENDSGGNTYIEMGHNTTGAAYSYFICRFGGGGTNIGGIAQNSSGNGVTFNTSSDYRLKENVVNITDGITRIKQLTPRRFNWISDETNTLQDGFIAHEVSSIVPEAITGTKDAVETTYYDDEKHLPEGKSVGDVKETDRPVYQSIDQSKLVPLLTAALQEAVTEIESLKARLDAAGL